MDNTIDNDTFGYNAKVAFLAKGENGTVKIYIMVQGNGLEPEYLGFTVGPDKARLFSAAIDKAAALATAQLPAFPL